MIVRKYMLLTHFKITVLTLVLLSVLLLVSSCTSDNVFEANSLGLSNVSVELAMSPSDVVLRSTETGTVAENLVSRVDLFVFKAADGSFYEKFEDASFTQSGTLVKCNISGIPSGQQLNYVALTNMPAGTSYPTSPTIEGLKQMSLSGLPTSPFVMCGDVSMAVNANSDVVLIPVSRSVSAIDISNADPNFQIEDGWWAFNLEGAGYVAADPATTSGFVSSLTALTPTTLTGTDIRAYSYPRNITVDENNPPTYIIVKGKLSNGQSSYYRINVNLQGNKQLLKSNTLYRIQIVKVTDIGYSTLEEAQAATADKKLVYTVSDWNEKNNSEVVFFGNYYLSIERTFFEFDKEQQSTSAIVSTNAPGVSLIPPVDSEAGVSKGTVASWSTVTLVEISGDENLLSVGVFENLTEEEREAFCYVRATGIHSDELKIRINITQEKDRFYIPEVPVFFVSPSAFFGSSSIAAEYKSTVTPGLERMEWRIDNISYDPVGDEFIESVSTPSGTGIGASYFGTGELTIKTKVMPPGARRAVIYLRSGVGNFSYYYAIGVYQDFRLDYTITYPTSVSNQMVRSKYVIETPIEQASDLEYKVSVTSNMSWKTTIEPAGAASWIEIEGGDYDSEGSGDNAVRTFKVKVKPNNHPKLGGYPPAKQAAIKLEAYKDSVQNIYKSHDIKVYQGGYVKIGDDYWLDRNLKTGKNYVNSNYPMLYPYAIPIGLPTNYYGAYSKNNTTFETAASRRVGDDGYFLSGAPQSGYYGGNYYTNYYYRDGYEYSYNLLDVTQNEWAANSSYNPCPPGWRVPRKSHWEPLLYRFNQGYVYGKPTDITQDTNISAQNGEMTVKNSGRYIVVSPIEGTSGGNIDWYLPAAGYRLLNHVDMSFAGVVGHYKMADRFPQSDQMPHFYFTNNSAFFYPDNMRAATSVRCVRIQ